MRAQNLPKSLLLYSRATLSTSLSFDMIPSSLPSGHPPPAGVVLDTNVMLDLLVFDDIRSRGLHRALLVGRLQPPARFIKQMTKQENNHHGVDWAYFKRRGLACCCWRKYWDSFKRVGRENPTINLFGSRSFQLSDGSTSNVSSGCRCFFKSNSRSFGEAWNFGLLCCGQGATF